MALELKRHHPPTVSRRPSVGRVCRGRHMLLPISMWSPRQDLNLRRRRYERRVLTTELLGVARLY